jgi:hypothetical protein
MPRGAPVRRREPDVLVTVGSGHGPTCPNVIDQVGLAPALLPSDRTREAVPERRYCPGAATWPATKCHGSSTRQGWAGRSGRRCRRFLLRRDGPAALVQLMRTAIAANWQVAAAHTKA